MWYISFYTYAQYYIIYLKWIAYFVFLFISWFLLYTLNFW